MRISDILSPLPALGLLLALAGLAAAQDTNFSTGPQYLLTNGSPLFARPIATPSLSFDTHMPEASEHDASSETQVEAGGQPAESPSERLPQADLFSIFYGSPDYETPRAGEISVSFPESEIQGVAAERQLPPGFVETGVTQLLDAQALSRLGYELTPAEAAAQWRGRKTVPSRTYTNDDIERLRQGS